MSTDTETAPSELVKECKYADCSTVGRVWEFHHGKFCSNKCEHRHAARDQILGQFKYDHTVCLTCFRTLKQLIEPKPDFEFTERGHGWTFDENGEPTLQYYGQEVTRKAATGRQYLEPAAGKGEKQRRTNGDEVAEEVVTGTVCEDCGQTDHRIHDPLLADRAAIGRLAARIDALKEVAVDPHRLHREYAAHADLELAVGRALQ